MWSILSAIVTGVPGSFWLGSEVLVPKAKEEYHPEVESRTGWSFFASQTGGPELRQSHDFSDSDGRNPSKTAGSGRYP